MAAMDAVQTESPHGIASVKAAISFYGERTNGKKLDKFEVQNGIHEVKMNISRLNEAKNSSEKDKALLESELSNARLIAKQLALQIEELNAKTKSQKSELQYAKKNARNTEEVLKELDRVKQELRVLKLDMVSAIEAKLKAEKEFEFSSSKTKSYLQIIEELTLEIDKANEEHVLVELARIEAERELREIRAQREAEAAQFTKNLEASKKRIKELQIEVEKSKELEMRLVATNTDVEVLKNEMQFVREMERNLQNDSVRKKDYDTKSSLESAEKELESAKTELASVKEEGFQVMKSMDLIRQELIQVAAETARLVKLEKRAEFTIQNLNSKLFRAKSKLESAKVADERAKAIVSNLADALRQLQNEVQTVKTEKEQINAETNRIRMEIGETDTDICATGDKLEAVAHQLEEVKMSEAMTLKKLKNIVERTVKARSSTVLYGSTITISKREHDYLRRNAAEAKEVAQKKLEASQAWIEALAAEEKEIRMRTELVEKEIRDLRAAELQLIYETDKLSIARDSTELELRNLRDSEEGENDSKMQLVLASKPRRSTKGVRIRRVSTSNANRFDRSATVSTTKRRMGMRNLVKFLGDRRNRKPEV